MTAPERVELRAEHRALILAALIKRVEAEEAPLRAEFSALYEPGSKLTFESPLDGGLLGFVQRTRPKPEWRITDETALRDHLAAQFKGVVETVTFLAVPSVGLVEMDPIDELTQIVAAHAPHLLTYEDRVTQEAVDAALEESRATGKAAAPGITLIRPGGQMRVVPDKDAGAVVERLVRAGIVSWDGRPSLPSGDDAEREAS